MEYVLTTSALSKHYKHFKALNGLDMHVPKGAIYGFVGKNGAGKTTLIRLICGLQKPTSGGFVLYGAKNTEKAIYNAQRRIGAVVETPSIYLNMTAQENLKEQYRIQARNFLPFSYLYPQFPPIPKAPKCPQKTEALGMRQRLGIAIALCGDPDFLVLDEPINGLDPQGIIETRELILKLNRERGITVLISSHILDELSRLATHYGFIDNGHLVKEISAEELEAACRKCLRVEVSDLKVFAQVADRLKLEYCILSEGMADIYGEVRITELVLALAEEDCEVLAVHERDESLESYYVSLIGGASHE